MITILLVEHENHIINNIKYILHGINTDYTIAAIASSAEKALDYLTDHTVDLVICSEQLKMMSGIYLCHRIHETYKTIPTILYTDDTHLANEVLQEHQQSMLEIFTKPITKHKFSQALDSVSQLIYTIHEEREKSTRIKQALQDRKPILKDRFLINLIHGQLHKDREILDGFTFF